MSDRPKDKKPHSGEKFTQADRDLIRAARQDLTCEFYFTPDDFITRTSLPAKVKSVDRYFVEIVEDDGVTTWVAKGAIFGFCVPKTANPRERERA